MTIKAINVRNQFKGTIKEIVQGDVLSEIDVQTAAGIVTSVITTRSVRELELQVGSESSNPPKCRSPSCSRPEVARQPVIFWRAHDEGFVVRCCISICQRAVATPTAPPDCQPPR